MTLCEDEPGIHLSNDDPMQCPNCGKVYKAAAFTFVNREAMLIHAHTCTWCDAAFETLRISGTQIIARSTG